MRFNAPLVVLALFGGAIAAPSAEVMGVTPVRREINEAEVFNLDASCKILKCIALIGAVEEIIDAIDKGDIQSILKAAGGSLDKLCDCAGCISPLEKFLTKNGVC